jgi:hypothetical protein
MGLGWKGCWVGEGEGELGVRRGHEGREEAGRRGRRGQRGREIRQGSPSNLRRGPKRRVSFQHKNREQRGGKDERERATGQDGEKRSPPEVMGTPRG